MRVPFSIYCCALAIYGSLEALGLYLSIEQGFIVSAVLCALFASIVPMFIIGTVMEDRNVLDLNRNSWTFILGDAVGLPFTALCIAISMANSDNHPPLWMFAVCCLIGIVAAMVFRKFDNPQYSPKQILSPTKLFHDFVAYILLFGYLVGMDVWALWDPQTRLWGCIALIGFAFWLAMGLADIVGHRLVSEHIPYVWP